MCQEAICSHAFDPQRCPLLRDLTPQEQEERMRDDPRIAACLRLLATGRADAHAAAGRDARSDPSPVMQSLEQGLRIRGARSVIS